MEIFRELLKVIYWMNLVHIAGNHQRDFVRVKVMVES